MRVAPREPIIAALPALPTGMPPVTQMLKRKANKKILPRRPGDRHALWRSSSCCAPRRMRAASGVVEPLSILPPASDRPFPVEIGPGNGQLRRWLPHPAKVVPPEAFAGCPQALLERSPGQEGRPPSVAFRDASCRRDGLCVFDAISNQGRIRKSAGVLVPMPVRASHDLPTFCRRRSKSGRRRWSPSQLFAAPGDELRRHVLSARLAAVLVTRHGGHSLALAFGDT